MSSQSPQLPVSGSYSSLSGLPSIGSCLTVQSVLTALIPTQVTSYPAEIPPVDTYKSDVYLQGHFDRLYPDNLDMFLPDHMMAGPIYVGLTAGTNNAMTFLLAIWLTTKFPDTNTFAALKIRTHNEISNILMFNDLDECDKFKTWLADYTSRFDGDKWKTFWFPTIPNGEKIDGYICEHQYVENYDFDIKIYFDDWLWILNNTKHKVLYTSNFWVFEDQEEMVMYQLRK